MKLRWIPQGQLIDDNDDATCVDAAPRINQHIESSLSHGNKGVSGRRSRHYLFWFG